jgi:predicted metalloprotease with PDZ domain
MRKGLPAAGDRGLNNTPTWGRTYWGGAMFCLLADLQIHQQTNNRFGLQDAMRGVLIAGGNHETDWPVDRIFAVADKAVGTTVLTTLYAQMGDAPYAPDLEKLWRDIGVRLNSDGSVTFDSHAPMARNRESITARDVR